MKSIQSEPKLAIAPNIKTGPRVALVHDYLNQFGGAERVLLALAEIFPEAPIYTLFYEPKVFGSAFVNRNIKTSYLDNPLVRARHRLFIPLMAHAAGSMDLGSEFDLIISSSASFGKGVKYKDTSHVSYVHAMMRYAWDSEHHLKTYFPNFIVKLFSPVVNYLKKWDKATGSRPNLILTNSAHTQEKIKKNYEREAEIVYPPVDTSVFYHDAKIKKQNYFLAFGRIISYKRLDLTIEAFNKMGLPLVIAGSGPEAKKVKRLIKSPNIKMLGNVSDKELNELINGARAVVLPQEEEFGLVAAESIACGTPVIGLNRAGFRDIIEEGKNGVFIGDQTSEAVISAIKRFQKAKFDRVVVAETAQKFSKQKFQERILEIVASLPL